MIALHIVMLMLGSYLFFEKAITYRQQEDIQKRVEEKIQQGRFDEEVENYI